MTEGVRDVAIRIKLLEMTGSVDMVKEHLPDSSDSFGQLGIIKDGIYKRIEYAIDICAILNADLHLGVPGTDEDILENLMPNGAIDDALALSILKEAYRRLCSLQAGD
ncbi:hypothetical protein [Methanoculleus sp. 7T]|uniref:hypothetical protein n=1 Tax=Methanoculleus sp. 7T TaxID=2937282 RepID=UPI0020BF3D12|nr:hypothetical protein [Methanoculleus sp. 7T]MCK8518047.1 hypothetical protein [Methanoculleus sp. 7T]